MKLFILTCLFSFYISAAELSPLGIWLVGDKDAKVEVYQHGDKLEGKLVWLKEPNSESGQQKLDSKNPEKSLQARSIMGLVFLNGFKKESAENKWSGGLVYDAKSGKTYKGWIKLISESEMQLRGYVGISLFGRTDNWTRDKL